MINTYKIKNFKSFESATLHFSNLNILSGINGSGKSSIIQSILLLKDFFEHQSSDYNVLNLDNQYFKLGKVKDVYNEGAEDQIIQFNLSIKNKEHAFSFPFEMEDLELDYLYPNPPLNAKRSVKSFFNKIHYLQASRVGPSVLQGKDDYKVRNFKDIGISGELVYHFINIFSKFELNIKSRRHINAINNTVIENVNSWLQEICPGITIHASLIEGTDSVGLNYKFKRKLGMSNEYRSTNVGFGISYVLPVIVQCLIAEEGELVIIDTPEAHLHPQGQSKLGELFAKTANDGVQLIIETHSDHVINGIRKSVVKGDLNRNEVEFYFFELTPAENGISAYTNILNPKIDDNAKFDFWPNGFFDEWTKSLSTILRAQQ